MKAGTLVVNTARPVWGMGLILRENGNKFVVFFEDGELRTLVKSLPVLQESSIDALAKDSKLRDLIEREAKALQGLPTALQDSLRQSWYAQVAGGGEMFRSNGSTVGKDAQRAISRELQQHCVLTSDPRYDRVIDFGRFIYREISRKH